MEDVLDVYQRPLDPARPLVCLDEFCKQLVSEVATPIPPAPANGQFAGRSKRSDSEYSREGSASAFMIAAPLLGTREVYIGENGTRTALDYADAIKFLCDEMFPDAEKIVLVQDNLNIHQIASLYKRFPPAEAKRLAGCLELHFTPKHGSWLNIAEIEISILSRCAFGKRRIPNLQILKQLVAENVRQRNESGSPVNWQFSVGDARVKLKRLYPRV